jgi:hypothetical protein
VSLLSDGRAANTLDANGRGNWRRQAGAVLIEWSSVRRTRLEVKPEGPFRAELWSVGANRDGAPSQVVDAIRL